MVLGWTVLAMRTSHMDLGSTVGVWPAPKPSVRVFAVLGAFDAAARGSLLSVFPLSIFRSYGSAEMVSQVYLLVGLVALFGALMTPWLTRLLGRRWVLSLGASLYAVSAGFAVSGAPAAVTVALMLYALGSVAVFVSLNTYVLDFVGHADLGRCEALRMFYSGLSWTIGPALGVWLLDLWHPAPFLLSAVAGLALLALFWRMRLGNGKAIRRRRQPAPNPLDYLGRFFRQPRLVAGWLFAVLRSSAWCVYVIYLPIYAVQSGLSEETGGVALSITNAFLFATPLLLRWLQRRSVRQAVRLGFFGAGAAFVAAATIALHPWPALAFLMLGSAFLILLDVCGGLPFLMAVKPSERTEMAAVYSSFRDVSAILTPAIAWLVLLALPIPGVFAASGIGLFAAWAIAGRLHPRLGRGRPPAAPATPAPAG